MKLTWRFFAYATLITGTTVGSVLHGAIGDHFIATFEGAYREYRLLLIAVLCILYTVPVTLILDDHPQQKGVATTFISRAILFISHWLFYFPAFLVMIVGLTIFAPFGWSALVTKIFGSQITCRELQVLSYTENTPGSKAYKYCRRKALVELHANRSTLCLDDIYDGITLAQGQKVYAYGGTSIAGLYVIGLHSLVRNQSLNRKEKSPNAPSTLTSQPN